MDTRTPRGLQLNKKDHCWTRLPNNNQLQSDASNTCSGTLLLFGPSWETARPVAFESTTFKGAELNYFVHEKELLAIIQALKKWHTDLVELTFLVFTDHKTLENFNTQKELSQRQVRWMEFLSQYDAHFVYVQGEQNSVADALSHRPEDSTPQTSLQAKKNTQQPYSTSLTDNEDDFFSSEDNQIFSLVAMLSDINPTPKHIMTLFISADQEFLTSLLKGYEEDTWTQTLISAAPSMPNLKCQDGLCFLENRLIIPNAGQLWETLFCLAHNNLGHFGFDKSYKALCHSYFWPRMHKELKTAYV
jgi:RNase H-like domain found in reverse transcriptase/Integrase zinc binding domain